ncbi:MAG: hypothetical protein KGP28_12935, partial [Bdellovibrionales bacterium]|nr:hypothetical protein [Bdellovibrionales bacterium]
MRFARAHSFVFFVVFLFVVPILSGGFLCDKALGQPAGRPSKGASLNEIYKQAGLNLKNGCKDDRAHAETINAALKQIQASANQSKACTADKASQLLNLSEDQVALEGLRRLKFLKEAQTIQSFFTYEILYGGIDLGKPNAEDELVKRVCPMENKTDSFTSIATQAALTARLGDSTLSDAEKKAIARPNDICWTKDKNPTEFQSVVRQVASSSIGNFKNDPSLRAQKTGANQAELNAMTGFVLKMKEGCGNQGDAEAPATNAPQKAKYMSADDLARSEKDRSAMRSDRVASQANIPLRTENAKRVVRMFNASMVSSAIAEMAQTPFGRLLVTKQFRNRLGIQDLVIDEADIVKTCNTIKSRYPKLDAKTPIFTQADVNAALNEVRRELPKSLADTLPYRYPNHFKPGSQDLDRKLAYEMEMQPDGAAAMKLIKDPPRLLSRFCHAIRTTEKNNRWNAGVQAGLGYLSTGLMVAGAAISFTGLGAPLGLALMGGSVAVSTANYSVQKAEIRDEFFRNQAGGDQSYFTSQDEPADASAMNSRLESASDFKNSNGNFQKSNSQNNLDYGVSLATTATGFGATRLLGHTTKGMLAYDAGEAFGTSAITSGGDFEKFVAGGATNMVFSQVGNLSGVFRQKNVSRFSLGGDTRTAFDPFEKVSQPKFTRNDLFVSESPGKKFPEGTRPPEVF